MTDPRRSFPAQVRRIIAGVDRSLRLHDWLKAIYVAADRTLGQRRPGRGPQVYPPALTVACHALGQRLRLSPESVHGLIADRPELQTMLGLTPDSLPSSRIVGIWGAKCVGNYRPAKPRFGDTSILTEAEAAKLLRINRDALKRRRQRGRLGFPHLRPAGRSIRYHRADVLAARQASKGAQSAHLKKGARHADGVHAK